MIALDTSSVSAYLVGELAADTAIVDKSLKEKTGQLPPVVLAELLSDPKLAQHVVAELENLPRLAIVEGYWVRVGKLRAGLIAAGRRARMGEALVAQSCLDHDVALVTRDNDFRAFAEIAGLKLLP